KWTQWIFLQLFKKGLAYKSEIAINWCTSCNVGLANEEVVGGVCERCGGEVVRKTKSQWMLRITDYAEKLLEGLDDVDFIEKVKTQQRNWIGKSKGALVKFNVPAYGEALTVFTTRPDTLFGATYMVISPEHPMIDKLGAKIKNLDSVLKYREDAQKKSDFERTETAKEKTGVVLEGISAVNPLTDKEIPIWVSDYVLMSYGTGAIMAVPAHDDRDWEFAKKFGLPIIEVVAGGSVQEQAFTDIETGTMVNSGFLDGMTVKEAKEAIITHLTEKGIGEAKVNYKLRDWVFSRQRYWGEPIPLVYCEKCGWVPVPESELPLTLPHTEDFIPTADAESPLAKLTDWVNTTCPHCGGKARRETDTMPQWAGSSWYFIRYVDPHNTGAIADKEKMNYWLPVDWYNGGMEHTTLHLLYSRFWHRFLYDIGVVPTKEPYLKRTSHGMILGENGEKMSKSRGNVINPDDIVEEIGADSFRMYEMFMGAFDQAIPWSTKGARGCRRFLERVWRLQDIIGTEDMTPERDQLLHSMIKKVSEDFEQMKFNTAIAAMMAYVNDIYRLGSISKDEIRVLLILLNPVAPHITEEMWQVLGFENRLYQSTWPVWDDKKLVQNEVEIVVQISGKIKAKLMVPADITKEDMEKLVTENDTVKALVEGKSVKKIVAVPGKLLNIVAI
ncbi:MAG: leucine--tRNA ligase, partial [Clostridia bacterium]|nr:leucine--tRNA ligase [Clostridia bacterium]